MGNLINFIKDKAYYLLGATVIIIILIVVISSCQGGSITYETIEKNMTEAAKKYYDEHDDLLPKNDEGSVRVSIATLVDADLLDEVKDPKDKNNECSGYVEVTKVGKEFSYVPFLSCKGNYEPKYLSDEIKATKQDEYGNGVYELNGEYVYRGDAVSNYISFNDSLWRVVKIDASGDIKIVLADSVEDYYPYDEAYNSESEDSSGIVTNYLKTNMRKVLMSYYDDNISKENKTKIVSKDLCVGRLLITDEYSTQKECSTIKENEKIGLLNPTDYQNASLATGCTNLNSKECRNYNWLASSDIYTWLLNASLNSSYRAIYLNNNIYESYANSERPITPVVYLSNKIMINGGSGTEEDPYVIK